MSIIAPTRNQATRLALFLSALTALRSARDWELVLVNDASQDDTESVIAHFESSLHVTVVRNREHLGRSRSRNAGVDASNGAYLVFADADRIPGASFVDAHATTLATASADVSVGDARDVFLSKIDRCEWRQALSSMPYDESQLATLSRRVPYYHAAYEYLAQTGGRGPASWLTFLVGNSALSRQFFDAVGGFNERFVGWGLEHFELGLRLQQAGATFAWTPAARSFHLAHRRPPDFYDKSLEEALGVFSDTHSRAWGEIALGVSGGHIDFESAASRSAQLRRADGADTD